MVEREYRKKHTEKVESHISFSPPSLQTPLPIPSFQICTLLYDRLGTEQNRTRQERIRQDKTRQGKGNLGGPVVVTTR